MPHESGSLSALLAGDPPGNPVFLARAGALRDAANADSDKQGILDALKGKSHDYMMGFLTGRASLRSAIEALPGYRPG